MSFSKVGRDINRAKRKLVFQAQAKGISENFGQSEVRELRDKYQHLRYGTPEERQEYARIEAFDDWCMNFTG